jgi:uncharacterized membrane protein YbhN (UPF0104 family)
MYRAVGINGEAAGGGIVSSWFLTTGIKLVLPVVALVLIVIDGVDDDAVTTLTLVAAAALVAGVFLLFMFFSREQIARRLGATMERWYNGLLAGRWKFQETEGLAERLGSFRISVLDTLEDRWLPATLVTVGSQLTFFVMLVMSMRFVGVGAKQAPLEIIFDAYAIGLVLTLIPILPAGLGVVEVAHVGIIAGESPWPTR